MSPSSSLKNPPPAKNSILYCSLFLIVIIIAIAFRVPQLTQRPMHTDEAVHAVKFGELLEDNYYRYDSSEYHGPTLYYFTLIPAWLESAAKITEIDETTLRIVPVFFGIFLIVLLILLLDGLGWQTVIAAGLITAISPAMAYFSRYYIQETLLVFFTFAVIVSGYRYIKSMHIGWALTTGVFIGLLHATKETCIISAGSMLIALFITLLIQSKFTASAQKSYRKINYWHITALIAAALAVSALFYSSFFTNPGGIVDSYLAYNNYLSKAAHNDWHIHPWYYYLKMLIFSQYLSGPVWSEFIIIVLAAAGFWAALFKKGITGVDFHLLRFISFYTIISMIIYSAIPYKTPWSMLGFLHGLILLAGAGAVVIINTASSRFMRRVFILLLVMGGIHLTGQSYLSNYKYSADPSNPYVYGHTTEDVFLITQCVKDLAKVHPDGNNMYIEVVCPDHDYWPLPWYLRSFPNTGWWDKVNMDVPAAPVIIASPGVEPDIIKKLYDVPPPGEKNLYIPIFDPYTELRPMVELRCYVIKELWDKYMQNKDLSAKDLN